VAEKDIRLQDQRCLTRPLGAVLSVMAFTNIGAIVGRALSPVGRVSMLTLK